MYFLLLVLFYNAAAQNTSCFLTPEKLTCEGGIFRMFDLRSWNGSSIVVHDAIIEDFECMLLPKYLHTLDFETSVPQSTCKSPSAISTSDTYILVCHIPNCAVLAHVKNFKGDFCLQKIFLLAISISVSSLLTIFIFSCIFVSILYRYHHRFRRTLNNMYPCCSKCLACKCCETAIIEIEMSYFGEPPRPITPDYPLAPLDCVVEYVWFQEPYANIFEGEEPRLWRPPNLIKK